jgi:hypothetical protein
LATWHVPRSVRSNITDHVMSLFLCCCCCAAAADT